MGKFGYGGGGGGMNMQQMMKQAQKLQQQMAEAKEELENARVTGTAGGGAVSVTISGSKRFLSIEIKPEVVDPDDVEGWVTTVKELIDYPNAHRNIATKGRAYVSRFSDLNMATGTMQVYERALDSSPII